MSRYLAVDRLVAHWDGPLNFRADVGSNFTGGPKAKVVGWWTHNYFMYEDGGPDREKRQFQFVAWDADSTWLAEDTIGGLKGLNTPRWDHPICSDGGTSTDGTGGGTYNESDDCISCHAFMSTGGWSRQLPPSCFLLVRAFAHPLRSEHVNEIHLNFGTVRSIYSSFRSRTLSDGAFSPCEGLFTAMEHRLREGYRREYKRSPTSLS
jgi:hypothetical protein